MAPIIIAENILRALKAKLRTSPPDLSCPAGDLFILTDAPMAGIRLKITPEEYFGKLRIEEGKRFQILPTGDATIPVVIDGRVTVKDDKVFINEEEVEILF